jgi:hypothetical protein
MKRLRSRLTYANVVATLALFIALAGGTAVAAGHLLPKGSVGTRQLKNGAVTGAKIKNGTVTASKIAAGSLGTVTKVSEANHATSAGDATHAGTADNATDLGGTPASGFLKSGQAAGGALSGTYPDPTLATQTTVTTAQIPDAGEIGTACTEDNGGSLSIDTPSPGTVVVDAGATVYMNHQSTETNTVELGIDETAAACNYGSAEAAHVKFPAGYPTFAAFEWSLSTSRTFEVKAGSHTYYIDAKKNNLSQALFNQVNMTAIFIPN